MKSIAFIIPYFGKLPDYFPLWLWSCALNPTVDFFVLTDDNRSFSYPPNVHHIGTTFENVKNSLQSHFDFPIALESPYKLCDYRPVYGKAFLSYLEGFDFWGHCDIDLIWGNIRHFFTDELLNSYERIQWLGHCSIYQNTEKVNNYYCTLPSCGCMDWKKVYSTPVNQSFDEYAEHNGGGLSLIMERNGVPMYKEWIFADLAVGLRRFQCSYTENKFYTTDADSLGCFFARDPQGLYLHYRKNGEFRTQEFLYCHFQKRALSLKDSFSNQNGTCILIPPGIAKVVPHLDDAGVKRQFQRNIFRNAFALMFGELKAVKLMKKIIRKLKR